MENYEFEVVNDQIHATRVGGETTVTLDTNWVDSDETEGRWEQAIKTLATERLEAITNKNGKFTLPYSEAVIGLTGDIAESETVVSNRDQAEALLAYFNHERILKFESEAVVLMSDSADDLDSRMMLNAAILLEVAQDEFDECIDALADAVDQLRERSDPDELELTEKVQDTIDQMDAGKEALAMKKKEARISALTEQKVSSSAFRSLTLGWLHFRILSLRPVRDHPKLLARYVVDGFNIGDLAAPLADVSQTEDEVEQTDPEELAELVNEISEDVSSAAYTARETGEVDEAPLQMGSSDSESQSNDSQSELNLGETETGTEATEPLNLIPIVKREQPCSTIKIGEKLIGEETQLVTLSHKGTDAHFYADPVEQSVIDKIGNKVKLHRNVVQLFDGIDRGADFLVNPDTSIEDVKPCRAATISTDEIVQEELERFLRETDYLLHPIQEVVPQGDDLVTFDVVEMEPTGHTTLRVTDSTEIEFTADPLGHE